jgi:excisionase family DNA binding protein
VTDVALATQSEHSARPDDHSPTLDDLVSVEEAARIAGRCERTIRRAYREGSLTAYRDGNGRAVHIRYGDLREWMMARKAAAPREQAVPIERPTGQVRHRKHSRGRGKSSENLKLLRVARQKRDRGL